MTGWHRMSACYLGFLAHALNPDTRRFRNFMSYDRRWEETEGSEDSQGRALWALGVTVGRAPDKGQLAAATSLFNRALPARGDLHSPARVGSGFDRHKRVSGQVRRRRPGQAHGQTPCAAHPP